MDINSNQNQSIPDKPDVLVNSSSIIGYTYDATNYVLTLWYRSKRPSIYRFYNVFPPMLSDIFVSGAGIGSKARNTLKGLMYQKLR